MIETKENDANNVTLKIDHTANGQEEYDEILTPLFSDPKGLSLYMTLF